MRKQAGDIGSHLDETGPSDLDRRDPTCPLERASDWKRKSAECGCLERESEKKVKRKSGRLLRKQLGENQQTGNWGSLGWLEKTPLTRTASHKNLQTPLKKTD